MNIKYLIAASILLVAITTKVSAETNLPSYSVKGTIDIKYNSRLNPGLKGYTDVYNLNVNVANSALFTGSIVDTPQIIEGYFSKAITQPRSLFYSINCDVVNPRNPSQTKNVGKLQGRVPIDPDGVYKYDSGSLVVDILPMGTAGGFSSKFGGVAAGKPLGRPANWMDTLKREAVNITRSVNGKTTTVTLTKYDKLDFRQAVIGAGPVSIYGQITCNGEMLYDYTKNCWFFKSFTIQYAENGVIKIDRIDGTIRWVEKQSKYEFDIRVNEPPPSANAVFETKNTDESAFFEIDSSVPVLSGVMSYKDTKKGETTLASSVNIDLNSNNLTKQQVMALSKIIIFSAVVPMNSD